MALPGVMKRTGTLYTSAMIEIYHRPIWCM